MSKGHFINGQWIEGTGKSFASFDPAAGETIWEGPAAIEDEIARAVESARKAAPAWASLHAPQRAAIIQKFGQLLEAHAPEFTESICKSTGKPRWEAGTETAAMVNKVAATIEAHNTRRQPIKRTIGSTEGITRFHPFGVMAVLGPFNFPGHLPNGHIMPALLEGNTVVFKPSELAPLVAEKTIEIWSEAGLPPGVINLVQGERNTGEMLVTHSGIDGVLFTGSFGAGCAINKALADHPGKMITLEMGGNNPLIVHQTTNLDAAAFWTIQSAYITSGQRCSCARRLIVVEGPESEAFLDRFVKMIDRIIVGAYTDHPEPFMGPVISDNAAKNLIKAQKSLIKRGAKSIVEMKSAGPRAAMLSPGLLDVTAAKDREDDEHFGPLLQLIRVKDFDAAIAEANNTRFGLTAGLLCDDPKLWEAFRTHVRAGIVNWNRATTGASASLPFGGVGCSGNNRPSAFFAADYCSYPVASMETESLQMPETPATGLAPPRA